MVVIVVLLFMMFRVMTFMMFMCIEMRPSCGAASALCAALGGIVLVRDGETVRVPLGSLAVLHDQVVLVERILRVAFLDGEGRRELDALFGRQVAGDVIFEFGPGC